MYDNIALPFLHWSYASAIRERHLALAGQTAEYSNDMFRCFVGFVDDDDASVFDSAEKRRIGVVDNTSFKRGCEHELIHGCISVQLDVFSRSAQKLT